MLIIRGPYSKSLRRCILTLLVKYGLSSVVIDSLFTSIQNTGIFHSDLSRKKFFIIVGISVTIGHKTRYPGNNTHALILFYWPLWDVVFRCDLTIESLAQDTVPFIYETLIKDVCWVNGQTLNGGEVWAIYTYQVFTQCFHLILKTCLRCSYDEGVPWGDWAPR